MLCGTSAEQAGRPPKKNEDENQERKEVAFGGADIGRREDFDHAEHDAGDHGVMSACLPKHGENIHAAFSLRANKCFVF